MNYLSIAAIFRQENLWLEEWIHYHCHLGVEHFYLYNNDIDRTESDRILYPYTQSELVDNIPFPGESMQMSAYRDAVRRSIGETMWLAMIDLDEFILPKHTDDIRTFMQDYEPHSGLGIYWNVFGSDGLIKSPPNQINYFLHRATETFANNRYFKSIVRPDQVCAESIVDNPHYFPLKNGFPVNEQHSKLSCEEYFGSQIRIIHYAVRSRDDFFNVKGKRGLASPSAPRDQQYWDWFNRNEIFDDEISRRFGHLNPSLSFNKTNNE